VTPRKAPVPKGLLPKLKGFLEALGDRYHRALQVIDEALASDNLKDKIWAVDWILKRLPTSSVAELEPKTPTADQKNAAKVLKLAQLQTLNESELLNRIRGYLREEELE
jgi:hypothetical protein